MATSNRFKLKFLAAIKNLVIRISHFLLLLSIAHFLGENTRKYLISNIIEYHNEHMKSTLRWGTQKNYYTTHKYIFRFLKLKHKTTDIFLSELNYKFIIDFERFLRAQKSMGNNTVMKHIKHLRKMVSLAYKIDWIDKDPFIKFEAKYEKKKDHF